MENEWVQFLDIINLSPEMKRKAKLEVLLETDQEIPDESFINQLGINLRKVYLIEESFQIVWIKRTKENVDLTYLKGKKVMFTDINIIKNLWGRFAGEYLLFLPNHIDIKSVPMGDAEETIGLILSQFKNLLMKTPDGHEVLYLYIGDNLI
ncbi:hypothetical protein QMA09_16630 [Planococcus sp. APC 3906]|uniref:hypothetical protein n=1 Tax=Planococcus sp. APC 3906 TaxID=3035194 RepID=UPI0025B38880|nr:hypothetical protein [Planococcus sp. APC 3906]MDN3451817.1 hypothetical protein [Planococcus sp. APC 3906]